MTKHPLDNGEKDILKVLKSEIDYAKDTPSLKDTNITLNANISGYQKDDRRFNWPGSGDDSEDIFDFYRLSKFSQDPMQISLKEELKVGAEF